MGTPCACACCRCHRRGGGTCSCRWCRRRHCHPFTCSCRCCCCRRCRSWTPAAAGGVAIVVHLHLQPQVSSLLSSVGTDMVVVVREELERSEVQIRNFNL